MKITPKFTFVSGSFDTDEVKMLCLRATITVKSICASKKRIVLGISP